MIYTYTPLTIPHCLIKYLLMKGLGVHGEMRCRARINLILALAKWQHGEGFNLVIIWIIWGSFCKRSTPYVQIREEISLLCKQKFSPHLNPNLSSLSKISLTTQHSLSLPLS